MTGNRLTCGCGRACGCVCEHHQDVGAGRPARQCAEHSIRPGGYLLWLGSIWYVSEYHAGIQAVTLRRGAGRSQPIVCLESIFQLAREATPCDQEETHAA
jgi:hypothetical protein